MPRIVKNRDNDDLLPLVEGHIGIGDVDEVNGPGAEEIPDFDPTRHELVQLLKYWAEIQLGEEWFYFCSRQSGSDWIRLRHFATRRAGRIARLLGKEAAAKVVDEVYAEFGKKTNQKHWNIFLHGDEEQWEAVLEEIWEQG